MTKQTINIGTSVNKGDGDPLRTAFTKINENFTELYTGTVLDLSAVAQHIIPAADNTYDLGSPTHQWRSLYVTGNTVYFGGIPLSVSDDGTLFINGQVAATPGGSATWDSITNKPTFAAVATSGSYDDLTDKPTIPSITGLATETYVNDAVGAVVIPTDLSDLTDNTNLLQGTDFDQSLNTTDSPTFVAVSTNNIDVPFNTGFAVNTQDSLGAFYHYTYGTDGVFTSPVGISTDEITANNLTVDKISISNFDTNTTFLSNVLTEGADSVGSQISFGRSTFAIQQFQDPEGDNNRLFSVFSLGGGEAILSAAQETVDVENNPTTNFGRVTADIGRVLIETSNPTPIVTPGQTITADDAQGGVTNNIINVWVEGGGTNYPEIVAVQPGWTVSGGGLTDDVITAVNIDNPAPGIIIYSITTTTASEKLGYTYTFTEPDTITAIENSWQFNSDGALTAPGDITTGLLGVGGRFIQDCADGTTSMRWINVEHGIGSTQIIRAYTGDPKQNTELERAQVLLNWQGEVEGSESQSGITLKSFDLTDPDNTIEHDWEFQGTGNLVLPEGGDILDSQGNSLLSGPIQPYLEVTNTPFITQPAVLGEPVTVTAAPAGSGATFDVVIGAGPVIESINVNNPGTGYVVGQNYNILYYAIGGTTTADNILIEVGSVGEAGEILTLAAYVGAGGNTPGTYTAVGELDYVPSVFDAIDVDLTLTRDNQLALFNSALENQYDNNTHLSPLGTEWNSSGWGDLLGLGLRNYSTLRLALNNAVGNNIVGAELVMHDTANDKYYKFDFTSWGQNANGGFAYTRTEVTDPNYFRKPHNAELGDVIKEDTPEGTGIIIVRTDSTGIYNLSQETGFSNATSPVGTTWNADGWDDLSDLTTRTYTNFDAAAGGYNSVLGKKFVMYVASIQKYYAIQFYEWDTAGNNNFAYVRYEIDQTKINEGVKFADGTVLKSAEGLGRVKLSSPGNRRIEEVHGYKEVSVTSRVTNDYTGISARTTETNYEIFVERTPELDAILQPIWDLGGAEISISFDNVTFTPSFLSSIQTEEYWFYYNNYNSYIPQTQGNNVYIRITTGAEPAVWWDRADLPGGSQDFRGAVIDYHAWTGESTIVGTIHIVRDSGEGHISHQEVASGSTDGENDDLWFVDSEGQISYRRTDGESKTLKVQWTAKVFYGSEFWD